jgi:flavorubredoxin
MSENCHRAREIAPGIHWVGAIDWDVRDFHGYETSMGSTYNAFLITGDRNILIDTVKAPFRDELLSRIASVTDRVDVVISNHAEPDHTGALPGVLEALRPERLLASGTGAENLMAHYPDLPLRPEPLGNGETLEIGGIGFTFLETKMLHWPDSMFTFMPSRNILFSQDAFGMHLAGAELFAHQVNPGVLRRESAMYYANIINPYSKLVSALLSRVGGMGIQPEIIAPDHGPIWKSGTSTGPEWVISLWSDWARGRHQHRMVVLYDTMWNSTGLMARAVAEGGAAGAVPVKVLRAGNVHRSVVATEILEAGAVALGSPTLNSGIFPTMADHLEYLRGLRFGGRASGVFGSHGWSGEAVPRLVKALEEWKSTAVADPVAVKFSPTCGDLALCREMGLKLAEALKARVD